MTFPTPLPLAAHHFSFALPKTKDCAESRVLVVADVRGSSHVLIGNLFWSHSQYDKLFFWSTVADSFLFVFILFSKNSDFFSRLFLGCR